jgi:hypothetical protein
MFDFAEFLWNTDPTYRQAIKRVIGYFMTDIEFYDPTHTGNVGDEDINSYREVLVDRLNVREVLHQVMQEFCVYGNSIVSMLSPIERMLKCPTCGLLVPADGIVSPDNPDYQFKYYPKGVRFEAMCPACGNRGDWKIIDGKADYQRNVTCQIWNPRELRIHYDPFTGKRLYTWIIPGWLKRRIEEGDPLLLCSTPKSMLEAIGENKDYRFNTSTIFHLREINISGINVGGWGVPSAMFGYGPSRYVYGLRRMNEALAADYMLPIRLITPAKAPDNGGFSTADTEWTTDMADWNADIRSIVAAHRKDPTSIHTAKYPVEYQVLGGEGKSLVPGELLIQGEDMQLNAMGIPPQLYRGDLTLQTAPMAARLFEQHWRQIVDQANKMLMWIVKKITPELGWKPVGVRLEPTKIADNMEQLMLMLQLMERGGVALSTIQRKVNLDPVEELRKQQDGAIMQAKMDMEQQEELDKYMAGNSALRGAVEDQRAMEQQGGAAPAGGGGGGAPGMPAQQSADPVNSIMLKIEGYSNPAINTPPQEMYAVAQEAAAIFAHLPEIDKRQKLREIEAKNPPLKALITQAMTEFHKEENRQFISQGQQQAQQQMGGAPPA